jgi:uncharacterized protein (DUF4213/DUF364 family)
MPHITDDLLDSVQCDAPVRQLLVGSFWTAVVLDTDPPRCGLASTLRAETGGPWPPVRDAGRLEARSGRELAELLRSPRILEASIGLAALNALLEVDEGPLTEANAGDIVLERGTGRRVAIVGHFPFIERVRDAAEKCWVLELRPSSGDLPASQAEHVLPHADVVALTGTALLNHTFDDLIGLCRPDAYVLLLGPSVPFSPLLFQHGVDALSGTRVIDPEHVLLSVGQGATFRQIKQSGGLRLLTWMRDGTRHLKRGPDPDRF